jgi:DNA mismatch repair ATPase MutS
MADWKSKVEANGFNTTYPYIDSATEYNFLSRGLNNPLLAARGGKELVSNDLVLRNKIPLTFLTGPNSGGKTTISKSLVQNQILGQIGCAVVAKDASMTIADKISYHVPTPPDLEYETGRFGYELSKVRQILDRSTKSSLAVLDDCLDGTTHEERLLVLNRVMRCFSETCGATLFSTHAHELVEEFEKRSEGQFLQVEFDGINPTHKLVPGVSHESHADRVAALYGFGSD